MIKLLTVLRQFVGDLTDTSTRYKAISVVEQSHATTALDRLIADLRDLDRNIVAPMLQPKSPLGIGNRPQLSQGQMELRRMATAFVRALRAQGLKGPAVYKNVAKAMNDEGLTYPLMRKGTKTTIITAKQVSAWSKPSAKK